MNTLSRREVARILAGAATACVTGVQGASVIAIEPSTPPPGTPSAVNLRREKVPEKFHSLPFEAQRLGGLLHARMEVNLNGRLLQLDEQALLAPYAHEPFRGKTWQDSPCVGEFVGKHLYASCNVIRYFGSPALLSQCEQIVATLMARQDSDGYVGVFARDARWSGWDVWDHGHTLAGLIQYYELTRREPVLGACRRIADLLVRTFAGGTDQRNISATPALQGADAYAGDAEQLGSTAVLVPLCRLYRITGDNAYLSFAQHIVRSYERPDGSDLLRHFLGGGGLYRSPKTLHGQEVLINLSGLIDLYRLTGDKDLLRAVLNAWDDLRRHQLYMTGSAGSNEYYPPDGLLLSLRSSGVGECCATVAWIDLNTRLLRLTGEARFGHEIERSVYNHLLGAQDARTGDITYYASYVDRKAFMSGVDCCRTSGPRGLSLVPEAVWCASADTLLVNLYTAATAHFTIKNTAVHIVSETQFPHEGGVQLTLSPERPVAFTLQLRVPEWATDFEVDVGKRSLRGTPGQLLDIRQLWQAGTGVRIRMDLPVTVVSGAPTYPEYIALKRGPQVLALERELNPAIAYLERAAPRDSDSGVSARAVAAPLGWQGTQLYEIDGVALRRLSADGAVLQDSTLRMIPFADARDYRVWLTRSPHLRQDIPAVTAFAAASTSASKRYITRRQDSAEPLTDENPDTFCTVDPTSDGNAAYVRGSRGKPDDPVWFAVQLDRPATISRVIFRHGRTTEDGGWFDTRHGKPRIEITRNPAWDPIHGKDEDWEPVATLDSYPDTDAGAPPALPDGFAYEVTLAQQARIVGLRVVGVAARNEVSCAELSAYT